MLCQPKPKGKAIQKPKEIEYSFEEFSKSLSLNQDVEIVIDDDEDSKLINLDLCDFTTDEGGCVFVNGSKVIGGERESNDIDFQYDSNENVLGIRVSGENSKEENDLRYDNEGQVIGVLETKGTSHVNDLRYDNKGEVIGVVEQSRRVLRSSDGMLKEKYDSY